MGSAYGWLSLIPPIVAITLAIKTKRPVSSLLMGVFVGFCIYVWFAPDKSVLAVPNPILGPFYETVQALLGSMADEEALILFAFIVVLGGIVETLIVAGGSAAFAKWSEPHVKTRTGALLAAWGLGILIFVDDYFNALTVGNVIRPISDRLKISRAKLAYICDATAAPVTILVPLSSWVATVVLLITPELDRYGFPITGFGAFLTTIPFNYFAWLTLLCVVCTAVWNVNFGPMAKAEKDALAGNDETRRESAEEQAAEQNLGKARASDLVIPMVAMAIFAVAFMLGTGGILEGVAPMDALQNSESTMSLLYASVACSVLIFVMYIPRRIITVDQYCTAYMDGAKSMVDALLMLLLAWTVATVMGDEVLATGPFVASLVPAETPAMLLPVVLFIVTAAIAFATGVSWGAMAIMIPPAIAICAKVAPDTISLVLGAVLAGVVFGDQCSPMADTTILSSTGAGCKHIDHVATQLPYALLAAGTSAVTYVFAGITRNAWLSLIFGLVLTAAVFFFMHERSKAKHGHIGADPAE
ncbi:MAG: Na+/H+ antiporter NhaC family protein [Atopobiaceae bacterium]|nr:Na+/H+ antiporter NhaC family protein [Atopobiaceae bacterium]